MSSQQNEKHPNEDQQRLPQTLQMRRGRRRRRRRRRIKRQNKTNETFKISHTAYYISNNIHKKSRNSDWLRALRLITNSANLYYHILEGKAISTTFNKYRIRNFQPNDVILF